MPLRATHILYRLLLSALILLSLLWLTLADWPAAHSGDISARLDSQRMPASAPMQTNVRARLGQSPAP